MKIKKTASTLFLIAMLCLGATKAKAQVNAQLFYDFGSDREFVTLTLEMFKQDKWGNTYFFIDHDFNYDQHVKGPNLAPGGTYFEIARCLNFWQKSAIKNLSLHVEYNGGITRSYPINNAWLVGLDYFVHSDDFKNTLNLKALYKNIQKKDSDLPMQFTIAWALNDIFGVEGLEVRRLRRLLVGEPRCRLQSRRPLRNEKHRVHHRAAALVQRWSALRMQQPQPRHRGRTL